MRINVIHDQEGTIYGFTHDEEFAKEAAEKLCCIYEPVNLLTEISVTHSVRAWKNSDRVEKSTMYTVGVKEEYVNAYQCHYVEAGSYERCFEILKERGVKVDERKAP